MGQESHHVTLYSPQAEAVWEAVMNEGTAYSRKEYVEKKYAECAGIFLTAYDAYIREAEKRVPRPDDKAYPYWAFASADQVDRSGGIRVMKLSVPVEEVVFFDQYDWNKVLRLSYIGESPADEKAFARNLEMRGIRDSSDAVLKPFYPDIRREIIGSWARLLRLDGMIRECIKEDGSPQLTDDLKNVAVQAGLWRIKKEWLHDFE